MTIDRRVRFTEEFFERLEVLLPEERSPEGAPSVTDFIVFEIPPIRDRLARDALEATVPTDLPDVRVCIARGVVVPALVLYVRVDDFEVEAFWVSLDIE